VTPLSNSFTEESGNVILIIISYSYYALFLF
jgi:hypothetical protein